MYHRVVNEQNRIASGRTDRRTLLLSVGRSLFERNGYRGVSIEQVTRRAGLSAGTFYNYFSGKEAFYASVLDEIEAEGIRKADQIVRRLHSPMNKLRALYRFITLGLRQNPILKGIFLGKAEYRFPGADERAARRDGLRPHLERMVDEIIREGTRKGVFRASLYHNTTAMVTAVFDAVILHVEDDNAEELFADLLTFLQRGLRRALRLRRRDERRDRRLLGDDSDWI